MGASDAPRPDNGGPPPRPTLWTCIHSLKHSLAGSLPAILRSIFLRYTQVSLRRSALSGGEIPRPCSIFDYGYRSSLQPGAPGRLPRRLRGSFHLPLPLLASALRVLLPILAFRTMLRGV